MIELLIFIGFVIFVTIIAIVCEKDKSPRQRELEEIRKKIKEEFPPKNDSKDDNDEWMVGGSNDPMTY